MLQPFMSPRSQLLRMFNNRPSALMEDWWPELSQEFLPDYTMYETKNNIVIEAPMPGLQKENINISLDKGILQIRGKKEEEKEDKEKQFFQKTTLSRSYRIPLPSHIDEKTETKASYKDGILKLEFAKAPQGQAKTINIQN